MSTGKDTSVSCEAYCNHGQRFFPDNNFYKGTCS